MQPTPLPRAGVTPEITMYREHYKPERAPSRIRLLLEWLWLCALVIGIGIVIGLGA